MPVASSQSESTLPGSLPGSTAGSTVGLDRVSRRRSQTETDSAKPERERITFLDITVHDRLLGKGSYGSVYCATSCAPSCAGPCAVKVLPWGPNEVSSDMKKVRIPRRSHRGQPAKPQRPLVTWAPSARRRVRDTERVDERAMIARDPTSPAASGRMLPYH